MKELVTVIVRMYSNYDCCNSFDDYNDHSYLWQCHQPIKDAVLKKDYMYEFNNGAYGGSLFCFIFKTTQKEYEKISKSETLFIPKGTQFGFYNDFHGISSPFERETIKDLTIPKKYGDSEFDEFGIDIDGEKGIYSIESIFGDTDFINEL